MLDYEALGRPQEDLLGQPPPRVETARREAIFTLEPGAAFCLAAAAHPVGLAGQDYRRARAQSAWAIAALAKLLLPEEIGPCPWRELAARVDQDPRDFLACLAHLDRARARDDLLGALDAARGALSPSDDLDPAGQAAHHSRPAGPLVALARRPALSAPR